MSAVHHGVTSETVEKFLVDAGAVYVNYDEDDDEKLLGATRDGNSFVVEHEIREVEIDGLRGPVKGGRRVISVHARITANLIEMDAENFQLALAGSDIESDTTHEILTRNRAIADDDYITNVALVGEISGKDEPFIGIVKNALADDNLEIETADEEEAALTVQFTGHFDPDDLDTEPWEIRFPNGGGGTE